jgi:hypothetical protein
MAEDRDLRIEPLSLNGVTYTLINKFRENSSYGSLA